MRKVCVVTGTRAEYGLLSGLISLVEKDPEMKLQLIVTGTHLSPEFGMTINEIIEDGYPIAEKLEILLSGDSPLAISKSIALGVMGLAEVFQRYSPDIIILLGDRFEILAAAQAALVAKIPVAHLYGGEITEGAIDDSIRHAVTKMAHVHFVATSEYRKRIIQLGEDPGKVFDVGSLGVENVKKTVLMPRPEIQKNLGITFGKNNFLVTYHPVTLGRKSSQESMQELLDALNKFPDSRIVFTYPNADAYGREILDLIREYTIRNADRVYSFASLGVKRYLSLIKQVDVVIGNSSSGITEVPSFGVPTVNIGIRQKGRILPRSVIQAEENVESIVSAINRALSEDFRKLAAKVENPYEKENTSYRIVEILKALDIDTLMPKKFHDLA